MIIDKPLNLRVDDNLIKKFQQVAKAEDRSENAQLIFLINRCVSEYEAKNGAISL